MTDMERELLELAKEMLEDLQIAIHPHADDYEIILSMIRAKYNKGK